MARKRNEYTEEFKRDGRAPATLAGPCSGGPTTVESACSASWTTAIRPVSEDFYTRVDRLAKWAPWVRWVPFNETGDAMCEGRIRPGNCVVTWVRALAQSRAHGRAGTDARDARGMGEASRAVAG